MIRLLAVLLTTAAIVPVRGEDGPPITLQRLPAGSYQPQAIAEPDGTVHVVTLAGDPAASDVMYYRLAAGSITFGRGVRVNSQPGSAVAMGSIRGAQMALGRDGRVHIVWNGSDAAQPRNPFGGTPLLSTRSNPAGTAFEPQRNRMARTSVLDGGGSVAADESGNVYVAWHGSAEDAPTGEIGRKLYVARSSDDGRTFTPERPVREDASGVCACCGLKMWVDPDGSLAMLVRTAATSLDRDLVLATSTDQAASFTLRPIAPWHIKTCPLSRAAVAPSPRGTLAAWETDDRVFWAPIDPRSGLKTEPIAAPGEAKQRHPALAANTAGQVLVAWTEGTGWQKGGDLVWRLYGADGQPVADAERTAGGIPVWGVPAVVARSDGSFLVLH